MDGPRGRREFVGMLAGTAAGVALLRPNRADAPKESTYRAIAFDGFALFDPRPIGALVHRMFPEKGPQLVDLWRVKQFDYQWLRALSGRYQDFWASTEGALTFAARSLKIDLSTEARDRLLQAWLRLQAWPPTPAELRWGTRSLS